MPFALLARAGRGVASNSQLAPLLNRSRVRLRARRLRPDWAPSPLERAKRRALHIINSKLRTRRDRWAKAVSYTHLTLPTICSV
eukprot:13672853-Alexandrium_andersonii.AAC.1